MSLRPKLVAAILAAVAAVAIGGCGSDSSDETVSGTTEPPAATTAATTAPSDAPSDPRLKQKPTVKAPGGQPPTGLVIRDLITGDGPTAKSGDLLTVQYVGVHFKDGEQFDASWDAGQPFQFPLGGGQVIPGWDTGVAGMRVGGRRQLIVPPKLGYGAQGQPPTIKPNETLVFVIDLLRVD